MAKVKQTISNDKMEHGPKKTCDGSSKNTRYKSKNDKKIKKPYRGQGH
jgi:hypothetical protein